MNTINVTYNFTNIFKKQSFLAPENSFTHLASMLRKISLSSSDAFL